MINRRQLLGGGAAFGVGLGLAGCSTNGGTNGGTNNAGANVPRAKAPTFKAYDGVKPTLPSLPDGTSPYFDVFPASPPQFVSETPGGGGKVVFHTYMNTTPKVMADNPWWQAINKALGVEVELTGAPIGDYTSKFQTIMASGDTPDITAVLPGSVPGMAGLVKAKFADLTEYLEGDAALEYPGIANIPSYTWDACTYNNRIYTLPIHRYAVSHGWALRTDIAEKRGAPIAPKNGEEFYQMLKNLSNKQNKWFATNNMVWLTDLVLEMMEVPNGWAEQGGNFTADVESERYPEALEFMRKVWAEELIHPSALDPNFSLQTQELFNNGTAPFIIGGLTWVGNATTALSVDPNAVTRSFPMMKWDGSDFAPRWVGSGAPYQAGIKQGDPERVKELLRIANWLASPWGTQEYLLIKNGIEGRNYTRGADGAINGIDETKTENMQPIVYLGSPPQVHFHPVHSDYAKLEYEDEKQAMQHALKSPVAGLESATGQTKGAQLAKIVGDVRTDIIVGRRPVSDWATAVADWKAKGGDEVRKEYAEAKAATG